MSQKFLSSNTSAIKFFWSAFSRIRTESENLHIFPHSAYSVRMRENTDQKNSKYGPFSQREVAIQNMKSSCKRWQIHI